MEALNWWSDDRVVIAPDWALEWPFSAATFVETRFPDGSRGIASGVMVGPNQMLTAAHVVYDRDSGGYADIRASPGHTPESPYPFGQAFNIVIDVPNEWKIYGHTNYNEKWNHDYALVTLDRDIGYQSDWAEIGYFWGDVSNHYAQSIGYPADFPYGTSVYTDGYVDWIEDNRLIFSGDLEAAHGASGSGVFFEYEETYLVGGLLTHGNQYLTGVTGFTENIAYQIIDWMTEYAPDPEIAENVVFRFYNEDTGVHFLTTSIEERDMIITSMPTFRYEGRAFTTSAEPDDGLAVFRFFNAETGAHFYTASETERDTILSQLPAFNFEGVAFYAFEEGAADRQAVYRFYNTETGTHFYTASGSERDDVLAGLPSFAFEGISYYVDIA